MVEKARPNELKGSSLWSLSYAIMSLRNYKVRNMGIALVLAIGIAHSSYYRSVPVLGVALSASLDLSRPFLVALMSFFLYQESLTMLQIIGGGLLISGSYLVIKLRFQQL